MNGDSLMYVDNFFDVDIG